MISGNMGGRVFTLHGYLQGLKEITILLTIIYAFGPSLDQGVKIIILFKIQMILLVVIIARYELPAHGFVDFTKNRFHMPF